MRFNICSNIDNGVGLQADSYLLKDLLEGWGHSVGLVHYKKSADIEQARPADVNIFLEVIAYGIVAKARQNWLIPNPEWFAVWDHANGLPQINRFLCKTRDAVRIFTELYGSDRVHHIGFESRDLWDPSVEKSRRFFHLAGQSRYKNSQAVAYAFAKFFDDSDPDIRKELVFVGAYPEEVQFARDHKNVKYIQRVSDKELKQLMNECLFHLIPSGAEGWGHAIHEGLGCGAVVITTNFPPMNEFSGVCQELLVPYQRDVQEFAARRALVGAMEVRDAVEKAWKMTPAQIATASATARAYFLTQRAEFRAAFKAVVDGQHSSIR